MGSFTFGLEMLFIGKLGNFSFFPKDVFVMSFFQNFNENHGKSEIGSMCTKVYSYTVPFFPFFFYKGEQFLCLSVCFPK